MVRHATDMARTARCQPAARHRTGRAGNRAGTPGSSGGPRAPVPPQRLIHQEPHACAGGAAV